LRGNFFAACADLLRRAFYGGKSGRLPSASGWVILPAAGLIVLAAAAAYHNSFRGPFIYDDLGAIVGNPTIRRLWPVWPVWPVLSPPSEGETVSGRPLLNLSLAINFALGGLDVRGYHATNLAIHIANALLLLGILRRTLLSPMLQDRFGRAAMPLALAAALLWTVHPLQTESVTYIAQRAESLAGFCYLLTLYCVIRGAGGTVPLGGPWYAAAVLACLAGMACKEVAVTAPLTVLLYDRTFLAGSFAAAWRRRWGLYLALAATWGLLIHLVLSTGLIGRQGEMGAPDPWRYACTQPGVILHYLRLSVWPSSLCMSYGWPVASQLGEILPGAVVIGLLLAVTVWGLIGCRPWAFWGAWFFLILAPTSSFLPLNQLAHEHRMYLSLAAIAVLAVAGAYTCWNRLLPQPADQGGQSPFSPGTTLCRVGLWGAKKGTVPGRAAWLRWAAPLAVLAAVLTALGYGTVVRNRDFRSLLAIWQDGVNKRPHNPGSQNNLGAVLYELGRTEEAIEHLREALRLKPDYARAHYNLGNALARLGKTEEAIEHYRQALRWQPDFVDAHNKLGLALAKLSKTKEAIEQYELALQRRPDDAEARYNLANALVKAGRSEEAEEHYHAALWLRPDDAEAHKGLGAALEQLGRTAEAVEQYRQALRLKPDDAAVRARLELYPAGRTHGQ
jgi:tetratricopeptide (TPR) repeat protein